MVGAVFRMVHQVLGGYFVQNVSENRKREMPEKLVRVMCGGIGSAHRTKTNLLLEHNGQKQMTSDLFTEGDARKWNVIETYENRNVRTGPLF